MRALAVLHVPIGPISGPCTPSCSPCQLVVPTPEPHVCIRTARFTAPVPSAGMDPSFGPEVQRALENGGVELRFNTEVVPDSFSVPSSLSAPIKLRVRSTKASSTAQASGAADGGAESELLCDLYMLAAGRDPNTKDLALARVGAAVDSRGALVVDRTLCAVEGRVWGAGDVLGPPSLASTGVQQATAAISQIFGTADSNSQGEDLRPSALVGNPFRYPVGIWTTPEMAYYGQSAQHARKVGIDVIEGVARYSDTLRGHVNRCKLGTLKLVIETRGGGVIGVFLHGDEACELVHYGMELVANERTVWDVRDTMFAAVTFHELFTIAADDAIRKLKESGSGAEVVARGLR